MTDLADRLHSILRADPAVMEVLGRARALGVPDWRLASGGIYQSVWNALTGRPSGYGIKDWDVLYFDASDLGWDAEDVVIRRAASMFKGIERPVEVRNQARVHLWFEQRFGAPYAPLSCTDEALTRYATRLHAVAVRLEADDSLEITAPFGLDEMFSMHLVPNRTMPNSRTHDEKARRCKRLWPEISGEFWDGSPL